MEKIPTPELDKMLAVRDKAQILGEFIDYLSEKGYRICTMEEGEDEWGEYVPEYQTTEQWMAGFLNIDLVKCEEERSALLKQIQDEAK